MDSFDSRPGDDDARLITGAKSSSGGKSGSSASSEKDTLFTTATVRLVDLLGEGEIGGVVNGLQGVYLNDVPVQNGDGTFNWKGMTVEFREGAPDQPYMAGFPDVETPTEVGTKVTLDVPAVVAISNVNANRARVTVQIPALLIAKTDGSVRANSVAFRIEVRYAGGPWVNPIGDQTISGKASSPFFPSFEFPLPIAPTGQSAPWQVRLVRISPDTDGFNASQDKFTVQSDTILQTVTEIVDAKFTYPHSALVGIAADVSIFGTSMPTRKYLVDGIYMPVPSNYDPVARTYSGIWDGTFKMALSDNPAWAFYLILQDDRFGLGEFIDPAAIDKWSLYQIASYCDGAVPNGGGGYEPRFTFNGVISDQHDAFELLELIAQIFRGMAFWSSGSVTATQDRPGDPVLLVTPANVLNDDGFSYSSSSRTARHTVAIVGWSDPSDLYRVNYELVEDSDGIARYGYNPTRVDLLGCTSRGQAHRAGLWALFSDLHETQVVTYKAGLDHAVVRPGDIVAIQDPQIAGISASGRVVPVTTADRIHLDRPVTLNNGVAYSISVMMNDGSVAERAVSTPGGQTVSYVDLVQNMPANPDMGAVWVLSGDIVPQLFRVVSIKEVEPHIFEVKALQHEPGKYDAIDQGAPFAPLQISELTKTVKPPTNLAVREGQYYDLQVPKQTLTLSWTVGDPLVTVGYRVIAIQPDGAVITLPQRGSTTADFTDAQTGNWTFLVTAVGITGAASDAARLDYVCQGWASLPTVQVTGLQVQGGGTQFTGRSCSMEWTNTFPATLPPYPVSNVVYVLETGTLVPLHREVLPAGVTKWTYDYDQNVNDGGPRRAFVVQVSALSVAGVEGGFAKVAVSNPAPAAVNLALTSLSEQIVFNCDTPGDADLVGYLVWVSTTSGFTPTNNNVTLLTTAKPALIPATHDVTYYVRAAAYDSFGKDVAQLNLSNEVSIKVTILLWDSSAPTIPGTPVLSTVAETAPDGTVTASVKATWAASSGNFNGTYQVAFQLDGDTSFAVDAVSGEAWIKHGLPPNRTLSVKVRAQAKEAFSTFSGYSPVATITTAKSGVVPANPTAVTATGTYQGVTVQWTPSTAQDINYVEVWSLDGTSSAAAPPGGATMRKISAPSAVFFDGSVPVTGARTYWLRSCSTSDIFASAFTAPTTAVNPPIDGGTISTGTLNANRIIAGTITGDRLTAQTITGDKIAANTIQAGNIAAGAITADTITVGSGTLTTVFGGSNAVKIQGGAIAANSISATQLYIGQRGVVFTNVEFYQERNASGVLTGNLCWTAGRVDYTDNTGAKQSVTVAAGSVARGSDGWQVVWWNITNPGVLQGNAGYNVSTVLADPNCILCATSADATGVAVYFGGSRIDGAKITALSITAAQISAGSIQTQHMSANTINGDRITAGTLAADKIAAGTITAGNIFVGTAGSGYLVLEAPANRGGRLYCRTPDGGTPLLLGYVADFTGAANDYGLLCYDGSNNLFFRATRGGCYINGVYIGAATIQTAAIANLAVDNLRIAGNAVTQVVAASANAQTARVGITVRGSGTIAIQVYRQGDGGNNHQITENNGELQVWISQDQVNWYQIMGVVNNTGYVYSAAINASYKQFLQTMTIGQEARGYGTYYYEVRDTNGSGVKGVYIQVTELSK